jgi:hypothetical protein
MIWLFYHRHVQKPLEDMQRGNGIRPLADDVQHFAGKIPGGKLTIFKNEAIYYYFLIGKKSSHNSSRSVYAKYIYRFTHPLGSRVVSLISIVPAQACSPGGRIAGPAR